MTTDLLGVTEITQLLGLTRQRIGQLRGEGNFPDPRVVLAAGPIWDRAVVEEWGRKTGRLDRK